MLKKNTILTGSLIGLILPVLSSLLFELLFTHVWIMGKKNVPYIIVMFLNLLILRYFARRGDERTAQGMMLVTFIFAAIIFAFRFKLI